MAAGERRGRSGELKNPTRLRPKQNHVNFKTYNFAHNIFCFY